MNNNHKPSSKARCRCGRYMTLAEDHAGLGAFGYTCPNCAHRPKCTNSSTLTPEEYYEQFERI